MVLLVSLNNVRWLLSLPYPNKLLISLIDAAILDYISHQRRLMPMLANCYAFRIMGRYMLDLYMSAFLHGHGLTRVKITRFDNKMLTGKMQRPSESFIPFRLGSRL